MKPEGLRQSQKHEKRLAKKYGGAVSAGSGAFWSRKGDVRSDRFLFEHKYTSKDSFTLTSKSLDKLRQEALREFLMPVFAVHLGGDDYVVLSEHDFAELISDVDQWHLFDPPTKSRRVSTSLQHNRLMRIEQLARERGLLPAQTLYLGDAKYVVCLEDDVSELTDG